MYNHVAISMGVHYLEQIVVCIIWNNICDLYYDQHLPIVFTELQVSNKDLVVDICPVGTRPEEVHAIQVGDIDTPIQKNHIYDITYYHM